MYSFSRKRLIQSTILTDESISYIKDKLNQVKDSTLIKTESTDIGITHYYSLNNTTYSLLLNDSVLILDITTTESKNDISIVDDLKLNISIQNLIESIGLDYYISLKSLLESNQSTDLYTDSINNLRDIISKKRQNKRNR